MRTRARKSGQPWVAISKLWQCCLGKLHMQTSEINFPNVQIQPSLSSENESSHEPQGTQDVWRPRQLGEGWSGEKAPGHGTEQRILILGTNITQTATILPRTPIFLKIYKPKWEEKRQKGNRKYTNYLVKVRNELILQSKTQKMPREPQQRGSHELRHPAPPTLLQGK